MKSKIGSGDETMLSLDGVSWRKDDAGLHTPGKGIEWELEYAERLVMKVGALFVPCHYE
jgi:hypothetical protein